VTLFSRKIRPARFLYLLVLLALCQSGVAMAGLKLFSSSTSSRPSFLPAEQAFSLDSDVTPDGRTLHFHITPGYYLYRDRFHFEAQSTGLTLTPQFARDGDWKDDPSFGHIQVYHQDIYVVLKASGNGKVKITWQGCADAGLCYPPQSRVMEISGPAAASTTPAAVEADTGPVLAAVSAAPLIVPTPLPAHPSASAGNKSPAPLPGFFHSRSRAYVLLGMLGLGLLLAFTPCVLPMLPIVSGIIARQHTQSALRGFLLSLAYVLGVASTYALTGMLIGLFGASANLPALFQHPAVLVFFSILFVALALSMFGLYELQLPQGLQNHFDGLSRKARGGQYIGSYIMGFFSALVVSPCVSAPLASVLLYISTTGDAGFGALALFNMGIGMGIPLLILGATEGRFMPQAGEWMVRVKVFLGIMLLGVAILLLGRILPGPVDLLLWAALATVSAVWLGALEPVQPGVGHLWKGLGVLLLIYSTVLIVGAATGNDDPVKPLGRFGSAPATGHVAFKHLKTTADLQAAISQASAEHKTLMLDFYADWCVSCKLMERNVFSDDKVAAIMNGYTLVQADITANDSDDHALLDRFTLAGPPAILFFRSGQELVQERVVGEMNTEEFLTRLHAVDAEK
jgi:thiol:disulfide interchange protein DsbD